MKTVLLRTLAAVTLSVSAVSLPANTPLLVNTDFSSFDEWIAGSNSFIGGTWQAFITDGYTVDDQVDPQGGGFIFRSWDDGASDMLENFLFQEFGAGPLGSATPTIFTTGDTIVFKGRASATRAGNDPSDMVVRAFIKTLGYNELGWAFQVKPAYSAFHPIGPDLEPFELSITYPDLAVDDSLQVIQLGFEITTSYDGTAMDSGSIYFEGIEGYVEGDGNETWNGFPVTDGWANTEDWIGWIYVGDAPWVISATLESYIYLPEQDMTAGAWMYISR